MDSAEMVYCATREEWRDWLEGNHDKCKSIWLIYYRKGSGRPRVPYNDAVEEALCFGAKRDGTKQKRITESVKLLTQNRKLSDKWFNKEK
jgi:uncharacterized protein YdeI (YjbR/CyaY-like superfamily)